MNRELNYLPKEQPVDENSTRLSLLKIPRTAKRFVAGTLLAILGTGIVAEKMPQANAATAESHATEMPESEPDQEYDDQKYKDLARENPLNFARELEKDRELREHLSKTEWFDRINHKTINKALKKNGCFENKSAYTVMPYFSWWIDGNTILVKKTIERLYQSSPVAVIKEAPVFMERGEKFKDLFFELLERAISANNLESIEITIDMAQHYNEDEKGKYILQDAIKKLASLYPAEYVRVMHKYKMKGVDCFDSQEWKIELDQKVATFLDDSNDFQALIELDFYSSEVYIKEEERDEIMNRYIDDSPAEVLEFINRDRKRIQWITEYEEKALEKLLEDDPVKCLEMLPFIKDESQKLKTLKKAYNQIVQEKGEEEAFHLMVVLDNLHYFKDQPWGKEVIKKLLRQFTPTQIVKHEREIKLLAKNSDSFASRIAEYLEKAKTFPQATIQASDFPIDQEKFIYYFAAVNQRTFENIQKVLVGNHLDREAWPLIGVPQAEFEKIFFSPAFEKALKEQAGEMTWMNAMSLAEATHRLLERQGKEGFEDEDIAQAVKREILDTEKAKQVELMGSNVDLIVFSHEEKTFDNSRYIDLYTKSGGQQVLADTKGSKFNFEGRNTNKKKVLEAVVKSDGPTTIIFNGHGDDNHLYLSNMPERRKKLKKVSTSVDDNPLSINASELAAAMKISGNVNQINLVLDSCDSYGFVLNLYKKLEEYDEKNRPRLSITVVNQKDVLGFGALFVENMAKLSDPGKPITGEILYRTESDPRLLLHENPAMLLGYTEAEREEMEKEGMPTDYLEVGQVIAEDNNLSQEA